VSQLVRDFDAMAERLENVMNAQSRLLNDISHELRSPLARLNVALGLARQRAGEPAQPALERIDLEADRLNEMIGRLLTIARLESGVTMEKTPIHLSELISHIASDADYEAQARRSRVEAIIEEDCRIMGDVALVHSAIENVVRNAMRYTQEGTDVEVRLGCDDTAENPQAVIRVSDSGPGVPTEALDKLFRPFYRIDDARGRQTGGVGLGLSITERAVRLHGGNVRAVNRPEGGLQIEIRLPLDTSRADINLLQREASLGNSSESSPASLKQ
jgi:two-component system sensor histidine kinase CpxA